MALNHFSRSQSSFSFLPKVFAKPTLSDLSRERHQWLQLLCLQEVKINPKDEATKRVIEGAANGSGQKGDGQ
jgi:hypothetical protein